MGFTIVDLRTIACAISCAIAFTSAGCDESSAFRDAGVVDATAALDSRLQDSQPDVATSDGQPDVAASDAVPDADLGVPTRPVAPFRVSGRHVVDGSGHKVLMKGFHLDSGKLVKGGRPTGKYTAAEIKRIQDWGFHFVYSHEWWGRIEDETTGEYDVDYLLRYDDILEQTERLGMHWIYRLRVQHEPDPAVTWDGWATHSYVMTQPGLQRYCKFLKWVIGQLEARYSHIAAYQMWQFPFHKHSPTQDELTFYYSEAVPAMVAAAREVTGKPLIVSVHSCQPEYFGRMVKVDDDNIIYGFTFYKPQNHASNANKVPWNHTQEEIDQQWAWLEPAIAFQQKHDVPLNVVEFGIRREDDDQIKKLDFKLGVFDQLSAGWCYWAYTWYSEPSFAIAHPDGVLKQKIVDKLIEYDGWLVN